MFITSTHDLCLEFGSYLGGGLALAEYGTVVTCECQFVYVPWNGCMLSTAYGPVQIDFLLIKSHHLYHLLMGSPEHEYFALWVELWIDLFTTDAF